MIPTDRFQQVEVASTIELEAWLAEHHAQNEAIWLVTYKKAVPAKYVSPDEVLDLLVAFGWIDGIRRQRDDQRTMQLVSPRRTKPWAKTYKDRAERLIAAGRMQPSGRASVHRAQESGAWEAMTDVDMLLVPDDLRSALEAAVGALATFEMFPPSLRRNILRWIAQAKASSTRAQRIERATRDAHAGIRTKTNG
ncbi:MAG: YdeI/OmpD-associated family protein [Pseudolysinimonas sp.]